MKPIYQIKYHYYYGDSYSSHEADGILEEEWTDLGIAKDNLNRIKEHYLYYRATSDSDIMFKGCFKGETPKKIIEESSKKDWFVNETYAYLCLKLKTNKGNDWQISAPWCGCFNGLHSAEIITKNPTEELKIEF